MEQCKWSRNSFNQWIEDRRLLEITVDLPDQTLSFAGRILEYNMKDDEISVYNEFENRIDKIQITKIDCINDEIDHYIDSDYLE
jgi:hypothetical protein